MIYHKVENLFYGRGAEAIATTYIVRVQTL